MGEGVPPPFDRRQFILRALFYLHCSCSACRRSPEEQKKLDAKVDRFTKGFGFINSQSVDKDGVVAKAREIVQTVADLAIMVVDEPVLHQVLSSLVRKAAHVSLFALDRRCGVEWATLGSRLDGVRGELHGYPISQGKSSMGVPPVRDPSPSLFSRFLSVSS